MSLISTPPTQTGYSSDAWLSYLAFLLSGNGSIGGGGGGGVSTATYAAPASPASVGTSSGSIVAAGAYSHILTLQTAPTSAGNVWLNLASGTAVVGSGIYIPAGGGTITLGNTSLPMPTGAINGISDSGTVSVSIQGA